MKKATMVSKMSQLMVLVCYVATVTHAKHSQEPAADVDTKALYESVVPFVPYYPAFAPFESIWLEAEDPDDVAEQVRGAQAPMTANTIHWKSKSDLPPVLQYFFAGSWVLMLCSMPFIIPLVDRNPVTRTQVVVGASMLVVLLGGFYLFTNIILFQSVHFEEEIRPLTVVECIYFMSQVITTVGYGDVTPAKIRGQVFVGLYVIGALFIIAMVMSELTDHLVLMAQQYKHRLAKEAAAKAKQDAANGRRPPPSQTKTVKHLVGVPKPSVQGLLTALAVFAIIDICWIAFFSLNEKEDKTTFQSLYMSVITLSSVGFGFFTPVTEAGMVFGAFFMLFGCAALVNVITAFCELVVKLNEWERFSEDHTAEALSSLRKLTGGSAVVTESQFIEFTLLQMQLVNEEQLQDIRQAFLNCKPDPAKRSVSPAAVKDSILGR